MRSDKFPDGLNGTSLASCCAACKSDPSCVAYVWSDGSNPDPNGNCWPFRSLSGTDSHNGRVFGGAAPPPPPPPQQAWWAMGQAADWYLAPAPSPLDFTRVFYELTGAPAVPPRHGVAFMATYWGYKTMEEVESYMVQFRDGAFPIDSFIMDYDCAFISRSLSSRTLMTPTRVLANRRAHNARTLPYRRCLFSRFSSRSQGGTTQTTVLSLAATTATSTTTP